MILAKRPEIDRFLSRPEPGVRAAVIHGKDRSGVAERAMIHLARDHNLGFDDEPRPYAEAAAMT